MARLAVLLACLPLLLGGCAVASVTASVVGAAVEVTGSAVGATLDVAGSAAGGAIDLVTDDDDHDDDEEAAADDQMDLRQAEEMTEEPRDIQETQSAQAEDEAADQPKQERSFDDSTR